MQKKHVRKNFLKYKKSTAFISIIFLRDKMPRKIKDSHKRLALMYYK